MLDHHARHGQRPDFLSWWVCGILRSPSGLRTCPQGFLTSQIRSSSKFKFVTPSSSWLSLYFFSSSAPVVLALSNILLALSTRKLRLQIFGDDPHFELKSVMVISKTQAGHRLPCVCSSPHEQQPSGIGEHGKFRTAAAKSHPSSLCFLLASVKMQSLVERISASKTPRCPEDFDIWNHSDLFDEFGYHFPLDPSA